MTTHTVFRLPSLGAITNLTRQTEPLPTISKHEVLIRIRSVALNSRDLQVATNTYPAATKNELIPCSDGAGDIVSVGSEVKDLKEGDRVVISFDPMHQYGPQKDFLSCQGGAADGTLAQYVARPATGVVKVPEGAPHSYAELASLVCTGVTAWNGLYGNVPLKPGQVVLLQGTGGVAVTGLILAKAAGATTIMTSSSDEKLAQIKSKFQPDYTINYKKTPDWAAEAIKITGGKGVDHILEIGGLGTIEQSIKAITPGGVISVIGYLAGSDKVVDVPLQALLKTCVVRGVLIGPKCMLEDLVTFVYRKELRMPVEKEFGFSRDEVIAAYEYLRSGQHVGKVCIRVD
ncbi:NAD(P)-binding protein [Aspergillus steynii IBT 23096]|uniref:NAD(P)-binding protein n=1 Tax=Aspergillus steynii IBT 23096 TaxID=1392250 RepID=A0A2I2G8W2_9EURO|nr:NAD(P)-binding protein [Aspergillus steynii IBT 23096]PLB49320.1 NAD(P)-binding protein [Aspergillus steynii IBT 23096]